MLLSMNLEKDTYVAVRGQVIKHIEGVGVKLNVFSKTDEYQIWIQEDDILENVDAAPEFPKTYHDLGTTLDVVDVFGKKRRLVKGKSFYWYAHDSGCFNTEWVISRYNAGMVTLVAEGMS